MESALAGLPSDRLLSRLHALVRRGNAIEAELLSHLGEVDARRLYLREACPSMFHYCVRVLHFAESVAYKRIAAARAARRHPEIGEPRATRTCACVDVVDDWIVRRHALGSRTSNRARRHASSCPEINHVQALPGSAQPRRQ